MNAVKITTHTTKIVTFSVFGKNFCYELEGLNNTKKIKPEEIVNILSRQITEIELEWYRKDKKQVLLFYKKGQPGLLSFVFAVEENHDLNILMKERNRDIPKIIKYLYDNQSKLNFNV